MFTEIIKLRKKNTHYIDKNIYYIDKNTHYIDKKVVFDSN